MDPARWQRIQDIFHHAVDLPESDQEAFLKKSCSGDDPLIADVRAMLEADSKGTSLLDRDMANVAYQMIAATDSAIPAAKEFGPYIVKELLGEGGMGVVYLAERKDLGNLVAIKILRDAWLSPARRERFAGEQRMQAQLNHPSIARLYDADTLPDGTPWFVMEYVEGIPITAYCQKYNCSIERRLQLFRQVCDAVQYAHAHAVIHRDLKPSNIFVKQDGGVRLLDFGIAKQVETLDSPIDQTRTVMRMMTPAYAAPEQIRGDSVGVQTDVYSLGVILYELLTDRLPFDFSNLKTGEAASIIAGHEPGKPSNNAKSLGATINKTSWADLDVLCLTAMHKDLQRRYRSIEALIRDIDHYLSGEPLEAQPDSLQYRAGKFIRRNWRAVSATAAVFVLVAALSIFFTWRLAKARNAALAEAARTQRIQHFMINVFQGGDESVGPASDMTVVDVVDRGVREAQALSADPKVQAEILYNFGGIYEQLGKQDKAEALFNSSLEQRKSLFGADSPEVAENLVALGGLRADQADYEASEKLIRQGLEMSQRHLPPTHPLIGKAMSSLGAVIEASGDYAQAVQVLDRAVQIQSAPEGVPADLAVSLTELANSHYYLGHLDTSELLNKRVLEIDRHLYGERHPNVAQDMINLGAVQFDRRNYAETERNYRQALDIIQGFYGKDHPETASVMTLVGRVLYSEGRLSDAANFLQDALGIQERVYKDQPQPRIASTLNELGKIAQQQGRLAEAEADFKRMADVYRAVYKGKHQHIGVALSNLAGVYMQEKKYPRAEQLLREALQMYDGTLPPDHQTVGIGRARLGRSLVLQNRYADAEVESRAGYEILIKQSVPSPEWLHNARTDLAAEYDALKQPEKAARFRAELATPQEKAASMISKN